MAMQIHDDSDPVMAGLTLLVADGYATDQQRAVAGLAYDEITALRTKLETVEAETRERAVIAGWNACRKSVYAVCEDVAAEADRIRITTMVGSASEEQHAKGYHAGTCRAAKSIARGFNSMEAMDDDNCIAAIRNLEPRHD